MTLINKFIRDITSVVPMPKSEARRRLVEVLKGLVPEEQKEKNINMERWDDPSYTQGFEWNECRRQMLNNIAKLNAYQGE